MPILAREPDIYPDDLLDELHSNEPEGRRWWALYCLPRQEKQLMRRLRLRGVPYFGPQIRKRSCSPSGRVRVSYVPLFSGYVFLHGDDHQRYTAACTGCVSRCLEVPDSGSLTFDLRQIRQLIESEAPMTSEARLAAGARVRVLNGALMGLEGVILRRANKTRLLVAVNFIQQGASVQLEDCQLEQI